MYETLGIIVFILLFVLFVPFILYKNKMFWILEVYLPNVDLLANLLTWIGGPMNIWQYLYTQGKNIGIEDDVSQILINYIALLGVTFIVAREAVKEKNIIEGWSFSIIMLVLTYLVPGGIINGIMGETKKVLLNNGFITSYSLYLSFIVGCIGTISIILLEAFIIKYYRKYLVKYLGPIIKMLKT